ncbi:MAG: glycoside hydrolase family 5 protein [Bacillota bacterium]
MMIKRCLSVCCAAVLTLLSAFAFAGEEFTVADIHIEQLELPDNEAIAFTQGMKAGWNLGNTFDAVDCAWLSDGLYYESAWVGVMTMPYLFDTLKEAGFGAVRIPVSWRNHVSGDDYTIDAAWLARVREVVGYALDRGLYVIVNTHHDVEADYLFPDDAHLDQSIWYLTSIWWQVAEAFREQGDRLVFEGMNEPRLKGTNIEWWLNPRDLKSSEAVRCVNALNQAFVDTVRAAGGENATRYLMIPGYDASPDGALRKDFAMPTDSAGNRLIVSVHAYTPYAFALQADNESGSTSAFDPAKQRDRAEIDRLMQSLYDKYIENGIPVVIGEYGARDKGGNLKDRADFVAYYVAAAGARGILCFIWDNHAFTGGGELFGLLDRNNNTFVYPEILQSMMAYVR